MQAALSFNLFWVISKTSILQVYDICIGMNMDWEKMPLTELRKSAKERGIKNYSLMKKHELIDKLNS